MTSPAPAPMVDLDAIRKRHEADIALAATHVPGKSITEQRFLDRAALLSHIDSLPTPVQGEVVLTGAANEVENALETLPSIYDHDHLFQRKTFLGTDEFEPLSFTFYDLRSLIEQLRAAEASAAALKLRVVELEANQRTPGATEMCDACGYEVGGAEHAVCDFDQCPLRPKPTEAQREGGA